MSLNRVILAVDPLSNDTLPLQRTAMVLAALIRNRKTAIEPVSLVNPRDFQLVDVFMANKEVYSQEMGKNLKRKLSRTKLKGMGTPHVLISRALPSRAAVMHLIDYARKSRTDLIALASHGRTGLKRFLLGSFAENVALHSDIPLLVVNPRQKITPARLRKVLFPTDLHPESKAGLEAISQLLEGERASVTLFNQLEPLPPVAPDGAGFWPIPDYPRKEELVARKKILRNWAAEFSKQYPRIKYHILFNPRPAPLIPAILAATKRTQSGLIAMVSEVGPVSRVLMGSLTRQVLREAPCPMLVMHLNSRQRR